MKKLPRALPETMQVSTKKILDFIDAIEDKNLGLHSFMLLRHGHVVAEGYWNPYNPDSTHMLFSLSKSFTSTAIGFAVQEGLLHLTDKVISFFPEKLPCAPCENMQKMEIRHLINMCTGHSVEPSLEGEDRVYNFLTSYIDMEPGSRFLYNTPATYMLSAILQKVTGITTFEYLKPRLFEPLGIENIWWETCPKGISTGGYGLNLKTEDIAKFAVFLLQKGQWEGRQLLNPEWIEEASSWHIQNHGSTPDWQSGYGYQFWRCAVDGVYRGDGAFGQYCVVMPQYDAAFVSTSGSDDLQGILDQVWKHLIPALDQEDTTEAQTVLSEKLQTLHMPYPEGASAGATVTEPVRYLLSENPQGLKALAYDPHTETWTLTTREGSFDIHPGYQQWVPGISSQTQPPLSLTMDYYDKYAAAYAWNEGACDLHLYYYETPTCQLLHILPKKDTVELTVTTRFNFKGGIHTIYGIRQ